MYCQVAISEYEIYGATNMITKFEAGRRYRIGEQVTKRNYCEIEVPNE